MLIINRQVQEFFAVKNIDKKLVAWQRSPRFLLFKSLRRATKLVLGHRRSLRLSDVQIS